MARPHRRFRRRNVIGALVVIAAASLGGVAWANTRPKPAVAQQPVLGTLATGTIRQTVSATGTIRPAREADINFAVAGTVTTVRVAIGDTVRKGQRLATIDNTTLKAEVQSAASALTAAQARLTADTTAVAAAVQISADNATIASATSQLAQANRSLSAAALTSPIAGRVATVTIAVGDSVSSGSSGSGSSAQSGGGTTNAASTSTVQIVVISTDGFIVNANVGSADVTSLKKGLQAQVTLTGTTTPVFGTVSSVGFVASSNSTSNTSNNTSSATTFPVVIGITGKPAGLLVGGTASVSIIVKQVDDVLTIPTSALATVNGQTVVHQRKNGKQVDTPVTVGATYGAQTELLAGLQAGDQYVLPADAAGSRTGQTRRQGTTGGGFGGGQGGFGGGQGGFGGGQGGPPAGGTGRTAP